MGVCGSWEAESVGACGGSAAERAGAPHFAHAAHALANGALAAHSTHALGEDALVEAALAHSAHLHTRVDGTHGTMCAVRTRADKGERAT